MRRAVLLLGAGLCVATVLFCGCKRPGPTTQLPPLRPVPYSPAAGFTIVGRVLDDQGQPLSGVVVRDAAGKSRKTDATGVFQMPHLARGQANIVVTADHFAPQLLQVDVNEKMQPVQFRLERGRLLRGRVTDSKGRALAGASVRVSIWPQIHTYWIAYLKTGSDGRFQWDGAPANQVKLAVDHPLIVTRREYPVTAGDQEVQVVVPASRWIRGSVVDDVTAQPLKGGRINVWADSSHITYIGAIRNGSYQIAARDDAKTYQLEITVDGYFPLRSGPLGEGEVLSFDARMKKGANVAGSVLQPDGRPAPGAELLLWDRAMPSFENGKAVNWRAMGFTTTADSNGQFSLPPRAGMLRLFVVHETGWTQLMQDASLNLKGVELRAWCTVSGRALKGGKPAAGEWVLIRPLPVPNRDGVPRQEFRYRVKTDADGRFSASRVVDGTLMVSILQTVATTRGSARYMPEQGVRIDLQPGETVNDLLIDAAGP